MRRSSLSVLVVAALAASSLAPATASTTPSDSLPAPTPERDNPPYQLLMQLNSLEDGGYLEDLFFTRWDAAEGVLELVIAKDAERSLQRAVRQLDEPNRFVIVPSPHDPHAVEDELRRIVSLGSLPDGSSVAYAHAAQPDASHIVVGIESSQEVRHARHVTAIENALNSEYPIELEASAVPEPAGGDRRADFSPFAGGAFMRNIDRGTSCTTGIPLARWYPEMGPEYPLYHATFLTADHCGDSGDRWETGASTDRSIGAMRSFYSGGADLKFIEDPNGQTQPSSRLLAEIYSGGRFTSNTIPIYGRTTPTVGLSVCFGGSRSGTVCNAVIDDVGIVYPSFGGAGGIIYTQGFSTVSQEGNPPFGNGDSGAPVYMPYYSSSYGDGAMVVGIGSTRNPFYDVPCQGDSTTETRKCSLRNISAPMSAISSRNDGSSYLFLFMNPILPRTAGGKPAIQADAL